jgi:hypothetical protein
MTENQIRVLRYLRGNCPCSMTTVIGQFGMPAREDLLGLVRHGYAVLEMPGDCFQYRITPYGEGTLKGLIRMPR